MAGEEPEVEGPVVQESLMISGLQDHDDEAGGPKKKRKKVGAPKAGAATSVAAGPRGSLAAAPAAIRDASAPTPSPSAPPSSSAAADAAGSDTRKKKKFEQDLADMDPEMQQVATLHVSDSGTSSAKSLVNLKPSKFMEPGTDHSRGHALARKIRDSLAAAHPHSEELQILERRTRACTTLQALAETTLAKWNSQVLPKLDDMLKSVRDWWPEFPLELKFKITQAKSLELIKVVSECESTETDRIKNAVANCLQCIWPVSEKPDAWDPLSPSFSDLIADSLKELGDKIEALHRGEEEVDDDTLHAAGEQCAKTMKEREPYAYAICQ
eukprot:Skav200316  [mRNA]  locus=scaffold414:255769:257110:- [translate_table: standard]